MFRIKIKLEFYFTSVSSVSLVVIVQLACRYPTFISPIIIVSGVYLFAVVVLVVCHLLSFCGALPPSSAA